MMQRRLQSRPGNLSTWEEVDKAGYVVVGSPETVRQRLEDYAKKVGFGLMIANFSVGNAPREYTEKSMRLFAEKVMPKLRGINVDTPCSECMIVSLGEITLSSEARSGRGMLAGSVEANLTDSYCRIAYYVDRTLKGTKPDDPAVATVLGRQTHQIIFDPSARSESLSEVFRIVDGSTSLTTRFRLQERA